MAKCTCFDESCNFCKALLVTTKINPRNVEDLLCMLSENQIDLLASEADSRFLEFVNSRADSLSNPDDFNFSEMIESLSCEVESGYRYDVDGVYVYIGRVPNSKAFTVTCDRTVHESEDLAELEKLLFDYAVENDFYES